MTDQHPPRPIGRLYVCEACGAAIPEALANRHATWHDALRGELGLLSAHSENLIERVYALESPTEPLTVVLEELTDRGMGRMPALTEAELDEVYGALVHWRGVLSQECDAARLNDDDRQHKLAERVLLVGSIATAVAETRFDAHRADLALNPDHDHPEPCTRFVSRVADEGLPVFETNTCAACGLLARDHLGDG